MYGEIVAALHQAGGGSGIVPGAGADDADAVLERLLGAHGTTVREQGAVSGGRDALAADVLASVLAPVSGMLAGAGGDVHDVQIEKAARRATLERALSALIRRVARQEGTRRGMLAPRESTTRTVDPSRDRRAPARRALAAAFGAPRPLLFDTTIDTWGRRASESIVYLDVSGSMHGTLPVLHAALVPLRREHRPLIHVFSTVVARVVDGDFDRGRIPTTGGTSITPVLEHLLDDATVSRARAAVVLTDGYFGPPPPSLVRRIIAREIRIHLGVGAGGPLHEHESWVASATRLPSL